MAASAPAVDSLPEEMMVAVFDNLNIYDRSAAHLVSTKWHSLLTKNSMQNVSVVNVFEGLVWHHELSGDLKERFSQWIGFEDLDRMKGCLYEVGSCEIVKIWFCSESFVGSVLTLMDECGFKFAGLDLYPYKDVVDIEPVIRLVPEIESLTIRPHGKMLFNPGVNVYCDCAAWQRMEVLALENVTLSEESHLPPDLSEFEWAAPRGRSTYMNTFLDKVKACNSLRFLSITHADFLASPCPGPSTSVEPENSASLVDLLEMMSNDLGQLLLIGFKFCKFKYGPYEYVNDIERLEAIKFTNLKAVKFDLCYEKVSEMLSFLLEKSPLMRLVSYECILSKSALLDIYKFVPMLKDSSINLKFSALQRQNNLDSDMSDLDSIAVPPGYSEILCRLDLSFVIDEAVVKVLLADGFTYRRLTDLRAIRCPGVTNDTLHLVAQACPVLTKLQLNGCSKVTEKGLMNFVTAWSQRKGTLKIVVPGTGASLSTFYDNLLIQGAAGNLPPGIKYRITQKRFSERKPTASSDSSPAFKVHIWEPGTSKLVVMMDYPTNLTNQILGFIVGPKPIEEEASEADQTDGKKGIGDILTLIEPLRAAGISSGGTGPAIAPK